MSLRLSLWLDFRTFIFTGPRPSRGDNREILLGVKVAPRAPWGQKSSQAPKAPVELRVKTVLENLYSYLRMIIFALAFVGRFR
jgi:hypothetical protein